MKVRFFNCTRKKRTVLSLCLMLASPIALAQESETPHFNILLGVSHDNNIQRTETNPDSDFRTELGGQLYYQKKGDWYNFSANYNTSYETYQQNTYDDRQVTQGFGNLTIGRYSSPVRWHINHSEQESLLNTIAADTPNNYIQRTSLSTGPSFYLRPSNVDTISANIRAGQSKIKNSLADRESEQASIHWQHRYSKLLNSTVGISRATITPDIGTEFNQTRTFLNLNKQIKNGEINVQVGRTAIEQDNKEDVDGTEFDFALRISRLTLMGSRSISDSGAESMLGGLLSAQTGIGSTQSNLRQNDTYSLNYTFPEFIYNTSISLNATSSRVKNLSEGQSEEEIRQILDPNGEIDEAFLDFLVSLATPNASFLDQQMDTTTLSARKLIGKRLSVGTRATYAEKALGEGDDKFLTRQVSYGLFFNYRFTNNASTKCDVRKTRSKGDLQQLLYQSEIVSCKFTHMLF